jgi:hypothetical protein
MRATLAAVLIGFARPRPARSGAESCTGLTMLGSRARVGARRKTESGGERAAQVGQDVVVAVRGDGNRAVVGARHEPRRHRVDQQSLDATVIVSNEADDWTFVRATEPVCRCSS